MRVWHEKGNEVTKAKKEANKMGKRTKTDRQTRRQRKQ